MNSLWKIVSVFVLGAMLVDSGVLAAAPSVGSEQPAPSTAARAKGQAHRQRKFSGKGWRVTIGLDPCVPESEARRILRAIGELRFIDRRTQSPNEGAGRRPEIPVVRVNQVLLIELADERLLEATPNARYNVHDEDDRPRCRGGRSLTCIAAW